MPSEMYILDRWLLLFYKIDVDKLFMYLFFVYIKYKVVYTLINHTYTLPQYDDGSMWSEFFYKYLFSFDVHIIILKKISCICQEIQESL